MLEFRCAYSDKPRVEHLITFSAVPWTAWPLARPGEIAAVPVLGICETGIWGSYVTKYSMLLNVLDRIRAEAIETRYAARYNPPTEDTEKTNHARALAFIHLFLKVSFGITDFLERESFITDGPYDGGIDGYFIDSDARAIYFLQSKFRTTQANFESKKITLEEILAMDIDRILNGENVDESGNEYNGRIQSMVRAISSLPDIGRYRYHVIIIANLDDISPEKLRRLTCGIPASVFDYEKSYERLVFPVVAGIYFNASDVVIFVELSNKSAGSKISYTVQTQYHECEITALFVPIAEIARLMSRYKNSILKYNPRSYLDLQGEKVNAAIRETVLATTGNEFALLNNGITMLSDETSINERIGQRNKAQLHIKNPQIINGGQTAYTLSRIYEECATKGNLAILENKEVLVKVITLTPKGSKDDMAKLELIEQISTATNQQSVVTNADRKSNSKEQLEIQKIIFDRYGLLYERKTGEFADGRRNGYVADDHIIDRNTFLRIYLTTNGFSRQSVRQRFSKFTHFSEIFANLEKLDRFYLGFRYYSEIRRRDKRATKEAHLATLGKVYGLVESMPLPLTVNVTDAEIQDRVSQFEDRWDEFVLHIAQSKAKWKRIYRDKATGEARTKFYEKGWQYSNDFIQDVKEHFQRPSCDTI